MTVTVNYSIEDVINETSVKIEAEIKKQLQSQIEAYKSGIERKIKLAMEQLARINPENPMRYITENVEQEIQYYCRCEILGKDYNVLMRSEKVWKRIADIGIEIKETEKVSVDYEEWCESWSRMAEDFSELNVPVYETHAHLDIANYNQVREKLVDIVRRAGISRCIIPAIEFKTCYSMKKFFDDKKYDWISYAFGSHPKYIWKEEWTEDTWKELHSLLADKKCLALGEAGLDYSYKEFCNSHRDKQQEFMRRFVELANQHRLPVILHIRPAKEGVACEFDAVEDAIAILRENRPVAGAVVHCFGGSIDEVAKYMEVGVKYFGIGGRVCYGEAKLEYAVANMPEESILLETDAPYIKLDSDRKPNTPLSILAIAKKIALLRNTSLQHILEVTYKNAERLFGK